MPWLIPSGYYEVLGVSRNAEAKTIKDAFCRLTRRYHPDTSAEPDAVKRFKEIAEAYGVLSDPAKRADHDAGGLTRWAGAASEDVWADIDFGDIFGAGDPASAPACSSGSSYGHPVPPQGGVATSR